MARDEIFRSIDWACQADAVDLRQYYDQVEKLNVDLRVLGHEGEAEERVEIAIRSGATGGEILGRLSLALPAVAADVPQLADETDVLAALARQTRDSG